MSKSAMYKAFQITYNDEREFSIAQTKIDIYLENVGGGYPRSATNLLRVETYKDVDIRVLERYEGLDPVEYQTIFSGERLPISPVGNVLYVSTGESESIVIEKAKSAINKWSQQ